MNEVPYFGKRCKPVGRKPAGLHKYGAIRTEYGGVMYDSKWEAECARRLDLSPIVFRWLRQVKVPLGPDFDTRVDFLAIPPVHLHRLPYFVEAKGVETNRWKHVKRLWPKYGPFDLHVWKKGKSVETIPAAEAKR